MTLAKPDAATLDAMVLGGAEDDMEAWQWLLSAPEGEAVWSDAVRRRRRVDRVALAIQGRPWLARAILFVRSLPSGGHGPELKVVSELSPLAIPLGLKETQPLAVEWGGVVTRPTRLGDTVELRLPEPNGRVRCFYRSRDGEGVLDPPRWRLEPREAPVLLLACLDPGDAGSLEAASARAAAVAAVILVEEENGETAP